MRVELRRKRAIEAVYTIEMKLLSVSPFHQNCLRSCNPFPKEDYDMWKPKLPKDYEKLVQKSNYREIYSTEKYEDLYNMFCKGILIQEGNVFFSLGSNGEGNEMISATKFSYKHRRSYKWRYLSESRFSKVAKMLDISNLKIQVKIKPQFISSDVSYGVYLVFKFCEPRKSVAKRMYVNLKYKKGSETLHTYFATRREDGWMMIELCRFSNHKKDTDFEFLLESFSRCYCESCAVYLEGIEFLAIENQVQHEERNNLKEVQVPKTKFNMDQVQLPTNFEKLVSRFENHGYNEELFSQNTVDKRKCNIVSAKEALYVYSDVKLSNTKPSVQYTRFQDVIELQRQQVFHIKSKIKSQTWSPDTEYACYLVFKLSEKCRGLHCPVIVRNLLHRKYKEKQIIYFKSPTPCNVDDTDLVPKEREDRWMEVNVWQFNSSNELRDDCIFINLKLISYEGTLFGLIISDLEFRPMR